MMGEKVAMKLVLLPPPSMILLRMLLLLSLVPRTRHDRL
jgi:hypothetical protein